MNEIKMYLMDADGFSGVSIKLVENDNLAIHAGYTRNNTKLLSGQEIPIPDEITVRLKEIEAEKVEKDKRNSDEYTRRHEARVLRDKAYLETIFTNGAPVVE